MRCSEFRLLKDESREEYEALCRVWLEEYDDGTAVCRELVEQLANDHWLMKRADQRVQQVEEAIEESGIDAADWTEEQHRRLALMHRYRNTAKRDFERSRRALEQRRGARLREAHGEEKLVAWREDRDEKIAAREAKAGAREARSGGRDGSQGQERQPSAQMPWMQVKNTSGRGLVASNLLSSYGERTILR